MGLLIFLQAILIPSCASSSLAFPMMYSAYKLNKHGDNIQPLHTPERLLLNHANTPGFLAPGGEEFNPGPETRLNRSELLCNKVLLKYQGDRESF